MKKRNKRILKGLGLVLLGRCVDYTLLSEESFKKGDTTLPGAILMGVGGINVTCGMGATLVSALNELFDELLDEKK